MDIPTINFTISYLITGLLLLVLAIFVYNRDRQNALNITFALYSLSIGWWSIFSMFMINATSEPVATIWDKICLIGTMFIPGTFFHFISTFLGYSKKYKSVIKINYLISIFFLFTIFATDLFVATTEPKDYIRYFTRPGFIYSVFVAYFVLVSSIGICFLFAAMRKESTNLFRKQQLTYLFWTSLFGYMGGTFNYMLVYNMTNSNWAALGNYLIAIYGVAVAYIILRYRFLDIEVLIKKTLVFTGLFSSIFILVSLSILMMQQLLQYLLNKVVHINMWISLGISIIFMMLLYDKLKTFLINVTNKYLFQKKYNPTELIRAFSRSILTELDLDKIAKSTVEKLVEALKLTSCAVLVPNREGNKFVIRGSYGISDKKMSYERDAHMISYLSKVNSTLLKNREKPLAEPIRKDMDVINASACFAIMIRKQLIGVLCLGKKKSDEDYMESDIDTLLLLADALGVAITNALAFEDVRQKEKLAAIGMLAAGIKHDIGTPINKMSSAVQSFLIAKDEGDHQKMSLNEIISEAYNLLKRCEITFDTVSAISSKFADFARPKRQAELELINVPVSIEDAIGVFSCELQARNISVKKNIQETIAPIKADKDYMQQILFNIIKNAAQAIEEAHRSKEESVISITAKEEPENKVIIEISDSGVGIPEDGLDRIFEPYYTTKQERGGTGLGLAIVKELVERNAGRISVKSELGKGTTFTLEFPRAKT